jgi:hypothetical protein
MTSRIVPHRDFRLAEQPENRLLEKLSDRGIDTKKLTLLVLLDALEAAGLVLLLKKDQSLIRPFRDPLLWFSPISEDDNEDEDDN